jgi:hypothetical protein
MPPSDIRNVVISASLLYSQGKRIVRRHLEESTITVVRVVTSMEYRIHAGNRYCIPCLGLTENHNTVRAMLILDVGRNRLSLIIHMSTVL